jgi:hypothetical protein
MPWDSHAITQEPEERRAEAGRRCLARMRTGRSGARAENRRRAAGTGHPRDIMVVVSTIGVIGAGAALFEAALIPGIVIGGAAVLMPALLPKGFLSGLKRNLGSLVDAAGRQGKRSPLPRQTAPGASRGQVHSRSGRR